MTDTTSIEIVVTDGCDCSYEGENEEQAAEFHYNAYILIIQILAKIISRQQSSHIYAYAGNDQVSCNKFYKYNK